MTIVACESLEPDKPYMPPPNSQVFQLLDGEYITRLDACELEGAFGGVRFHTNRRVSLIYGRCESMRQFVEAPRGCYIHNVFGSTRGNDCTVLGAVFTPLGRLSAQVSRLPSADELVCSPIEPTVELQKRGETLVALQHDLKAVVVTTNQYDRIVGLRVLSSGQYGDYLSLQNQLSSRTKWRDHWLELVDEERITVVDVCCNDTHGLRLNFKTSYRTAPWVGCKTSEQGTLKSLKPPVNATICAFRKKHDIGSARLDLQAPTLQEDSVILLFPVIIT